MAIPGLEQLMERYLSDPAFKQRLQADPEGAARAAGLTLTAEERAALGQLDFNLPDAELQARVSKGRRAP